ncbi:hypothetical protein [Natronorubrum halophilum]|uniref:hypothetical protein n=1 Tax=Natronorubrum halophilum TaxID=1702106 RepID=UPI0010C1E722|nr:hypothetical protein [Natronorubrum halophilum]
MPDQSTVALVDIGRVLLTVLIAGLLLVFNYGSLVVTAADVAAAAAVFLVGGYLTLTAMDLLIDRLPWKD